MATTKAKAQDHNIFLIDNSPRVSHVEARAAGEAVLRHLQFALWEAADKASGRDLGALAVQEQCAVVIAGSRETSNQWRREEPSACTEHILELPRDEGQPGTLRCLGTLTPTLVDALMTSEVFQPPRDAAGKVLQYDADLLSAMLSCAMLNDAHRALQRSLNVPTVVQSAPAHLTVISNFVDLGADPCGDADDAAFLQAALRELRTRCVASLRLVLIDLDADIARGGAFQSAEAFRGTAPPRVPSAAQAQLRDDVLGFLENNELNFPVHITRCRSLEAVIAALEDTAVAYTTICAAPLEIGGRPEEGGVGITIPAHIVKLSSPEALPPALRGTPLAPSADTRVPLQYDQKRLTVQRRFVREVEVPVGPDKNQKSGPQFQKVALDVPPEDVVEAYHYGRMLVPKGEKGSDENEVFRYRPDALEGGASLRLLGFLRPPEGEQPYERRVLERYHLLEGGYALVPSRQPSEVVPSARGLSALARAMRAHNREAMVLRLVARKNADVAIYAAFPHVSDHPGKIDHFVLRRLPFAEDLRPVPVAENRDPELSFSREQFRAMDRLIDAMQLVPTEGGGETAERVACGATPNPAPGRVMKMLHDKWKDPARPCRFKGLGRDLADPSVDLLSWALFEDLRDSLVLRHAAWPRAEDGARGATGGTGPGGAAVRQFASLPDLWADVGAKFNVEVFEPKGGKGGRKRNAADMEGEGGGEGVEDEEPERNPGPGPL